MEYISRFYDQILKLYDIKIFGTTFDIIKVIIIAYIAKKLGYLLIDRFYVMQEKSKLQFSERKVKTLSSLTKNILKYVIYFVAVYSILEILGLKMGSILAVAGIGSLAVGFGAQSLVKDVITGFFIIFEDQFGVGDYITINNFSGTVEEIGLRVTKIRDFSGDLNIIPNGEITSVTNHSKGAMRALVAVSVSYEEDVDRVIEALNEICTEMKRDRTDLLDGPKVLGITNFKDSAVEITVVAMAKPMQQWAVERDLRYRIKKLFKDYDIDLPYPHMNVSIEDKNKKGDVSAERD
ncbi:MULTISPECIES: mechanosensitive ion channel family protein [Thermoanaerobacterium]|uniref:Mechanosensitive ion channel protein MscS n=2 Tax=Thermoanaerobacterium TaxID=28895 RepID=W9EFD6_9THEO|nr:MULTISPECIES: mechanosensitive ion channel family protein [Thermoanaerobacterium]AFK85558.1 MscS Mechanosensitive ion channel [Thermoanaerobacterium saccharolyticum JW/SL-YS485]ETO39725.1 mechanosensitive ion channel protein MscS [Thermoanaerobacterium aotearoense SCUT27]